MTQKSDPDFRPELLAPAGGRESFFAAVNHGADAVYLGLSEFSARAKAENFSVENLPEYTRYAHLFGVKVYVAINTLIKDDEFLSALTLAEGAWNAGADALIIQDKGLFKEIKRLMPDIPLHFSTQGGIHNSFGAAEAKRMGAERVILSREMSLKDIAAIGKSADIDTEFFVHGALCVSFSGNCYFSGQVSGYSGNRGRCMQLCRKEYRQNGQNSGYFLSPKDICFAGEIDALKNAGVKSFKIEGRLKKPEYVAGVVSVYRKALDGKAVTGEDISRLSALFNRGGFSKGHLYGGAGNIIYEKAQGHLGVRIGTVDRVSGGVAYIKTASGKRLNAGDGVKFFDKDKESGGGLCVRENEIAYSGAPSEGDICCQTLDAAYSEELLGYKRKIPVVIKSKLIAGQPAEMTAESFGKSFTAYGSAVAYAESRPLTEADALKSLTKLGGTVFAPIAAQAETSNAFMPVSMLNGLRREVCEGLEKQLLAAYDRKSVSFDRAAVGKQKGQKGCGRIAVIAESADCITPLMAAKCSLVIHSPAEYGLEGIIAAKEIAGDKYVLRLPPVAFEDDLAYLKDIAGRAQVKSFLAENIYGRAFADAIATDAVVIDGPMQNIINSRSGSGAFILGYDADKTLGQGEYVLAFGKVPLMTFCHCPNLTGGKTCDSCGHVKEYTDEYGNSFPLRRVKAAKCYHTLLNSLPVYNKALIAGGSDVLFDFTGYSPKETGETFNKLIDGQEIGIKYTRGMIGKKLF